MRTRDELLDTAFDLLKELFGKMTTSQMAVFHDWVVDYTLTPRDEE